MAGTVANAPPSAKNTKKGRKKPRVKKGRKAKSKDKSAPHPPETKKDFELYARIVAEKYLLPHAKSPHFKVRQIIFGRGGVGIFQ